jgi:hypothetical protein
MRRLEDEQGHEAQAPMCLCGVLGEGEEVSEWKSIETAPRDGTVLWLFSRVHGMVEGAWEQVDGGGHPDNGPAIFWWASPHVEFIDGPYDAPTHWMPLPDPPKAP